MPKPEVTWYFEDKLIVKNQLLVLNASSVKYTYSLKNGSLTVSNLKSEDNGVYFCSAASIDKFPPARINYTIKSIDIKKQYIYVILRYPAQSIKITQFGSFGFIFSFFCLIKQSLFSK